LKLCLFESERKRTGCGTLVRVPQRDKVRLDKQDVLILVWNAHQ
jgi:hypothetical protein